MLEHPEAERADPYEKDVERVWRDSGKVYGARKIRHALGHEGVTLSRRRVNRIMKGNGMAGSCSKAAYRPRPARPDDDPAPDILAREFNGYAPRTHLASDPAYVRVGSSWAYVCLPGDLASRQIAGHSVGVGHDADLVPAAFAALRFPLDEIEVFHTDRGGGFAGERIERMLDVFGVTRSLSRPGNPYDNAVVESTNRLVRKELIHRNVYTNVEQLRSDVFSKYLGVNIRLYHLAIIRVFRPLGGCRRLRYFWYVRISHRYIDLSFCNHVQGRCGKGAAKL